MPAIRRIAQLGQAVGTGGRVGRDFRPAVGVRLGGSNAEARLAERLKLVSGYVGNARQRRQTLNQISLEGDYVRRRPLDLDDGSVAAVGDVAGQGALAGQAVHVRPKAHALHLPAHVEASSNNGIRSGGHSSLQLGACPTCATAS